MTAELDKLAYSIPNLAIAVDLSIDTVRKHIAEGNLVPSYPNSKPIITRTEAQRWLSSLPAERKSA
ncbi:hypothetical protein [Glaciihabitans sp. UYNi722]|uniref:hypothetical protein n=1 Tax=Glaciihabitans sp. UYNi722 TaxID=3156344 RepID=UPI0033950423